MRSRLPTAAEAQARRVTRLAVGGEAILGAAAMAWISARDLPVRFTGGATDLLLGMASASVLALINIGLLRYGPDVWPIRSMRRLYGSVLQPLFGHLTAVQIVTISVAAGVAEEMFFRGAVQTEWGLPLASLSFGLVHVGRIDMVPLGLWAAVAGVWLGWLALGTHGLLAPISAHATYDALALLYIRLGSTRGDVAPTAEESP